MPCKDSAQIVVLREKFLLLSPCDLNLLQDLGDGVLLGVHIRKGGGEL